MFYRLVASLPKPHLALFHLKYDQLDDSDFDIVQYSVFILDGDIFSPCFLWFIQLIRFAICYEFNV